MSAPVDATTPPGPALPAVGDEVPRLERRPDEVDLFMFSAAAWLLHRVHYDADFTTGHDGHPGLLVHGPLQGAWMMHAVQSWLGVRVRPRSVTYRHFAPAYVGDGLECGGTVTAVEEDSFDADLWVRKTDGTITTRGSASFNLPPADRARS